MSKYYLIIFLLSTVINIQAGVKNIERHFRTNEKQVIEISELGGSNIQIKSWDKDEVSVKLRVEFNSSKEKYENNYLKSADVIANQGEDYLKLRYRTIGEEGKWSYFLGIKYNFMYSEYGDVSGEIYIPRKNSLKTNFTYGRIFLQDMEGHIELRGNGCRIEAGNCKKIGVIDNNYGTVKLQNCDGNLDLSCLSGKIDINNLKGEAKINGDYSNIIIEGVSGNVNINGKSGTHSIRNVKANLNLSADYSNVNINDISGYVYVQDRSGTINVDKSEGIKIIGTYSKMNLSNIGTQAGKTFIIKGQSGKLYMDNIKGNLSIDNPYSDMELKNIDGDITVTGRSSLLYAEKINGNIHCETEYEKIMLHDINSKNLKINNRSGLIDLKLSSVPKEIKIENEYGDIKINMPEGFNGTVEAGAEYGGVKSNLPLTVSTKNNLTEISGRVGSGQGLIKLHTRSANIFLNQK